VNEFWFHFSQFPNLFYAHRTHPGGTETDCSGGCEEVASRE
jgi:hypothetical protein